MRYVIFIITLLLLNGSSLHAQPVQHATHDSLQTIIKPTRYTGQDGSKHYYIQYYQGLASQAGSVMRSFSMRQRRDKSQYHKFPMASFFAPWLFTLTNEKRTQALKLFAPLMDSIRQSGADSLRAEILVIGYTDEQLFTAEMLAQLPQFEGMLNDANQTQRNAQLYLSYLRAREIGSIIEQELSAFPEMFASFSNILITLNMEGRGTEFPEENKLYKPIDEKRRIVKVYWKIY